MTQYTDRLALMTYYLKVDVYLLDEAKKNLDLQSFLKFYRSLDCMTRSNSSLALYYNFEKKELGLSKNSEVVWKEVKSNKDILQNFVWCVYMKVYKIRNREDLPFLHSIYDDIVEQDLPYRVIFGKMFQWIRSLEIED